MLKQNKENYNLIIIVLVKLFLLKMYFLNFLKFHSRNCDI